VHHRYDKINIPIELLRTLVAIAELGSFTKAGGALKLTQSAISAQVKRLQQLVGSEFFTKPGLRLTGSGELVLGYAQRILAMNDQILLLSGAQSRGQLRVGIPVSLADYALPMLLGQSASDRGIKHAQFRCDVTEEMLKCLTGGRLDVAVLTCPSRTPNNVYSEWPDQMVFACAPDFLLSPGAPLPLISWPGSVSDRVAIEACERHGVAYSIVCVTADCHARRLAMQSGLGFAAMFERAVPPQLKIARDYFLPPLPQLTGGIYLREGLEPRPVEQLEALNAIFNPTATTAAARAHREERKVANMR
jgi:DNA-binding transcriptional LysR family regulator